MSLSGVRVLAAVRDAVARITNAVGQAGAMMALMLVACAAMPTPALGALELPGCRDTTLPRNDDASSDAVSLPFEVKFYGSPYNTLYVNNNGNVTFDSPLSTYVPFNLTQTNRVIIAPFFADVDTRPADGGTVTYGETVYDGRPAFCVLWEDVGYYSQQTDRRNTFQLLLVRRTPGSGDFDIVFRYSNIDWELGSASSGVPARAGFSNGVPERSVELEGSATSGAFLDGGSHSLVSGSINSNIPGTWIFRVLSGAAGNDPRNVPFGYAQSSAWWTWPDQDGDGLPDHWETHGVWVGERFVDLAARGALVAQKDAFVYVDVVEGERWNSTIESLVRSSFANSPLAIRLHFVGGNTLQRSAVPVEISAGDTFFATMARLGFSDSGLAGSPGSVPALAKYICVCPDHKDGDGVGGEANGIKADHLVVTMYEARWIDAIEAQTGVRFSNDGLVGDRLNAVTAMHELGHLYGLRHHGTEHAPTTDYTYKSIMTYAFNAFGVPRSASEAVETGDLLPRIDYNRSSIVNLDWRLGGGFGALSLIFGQDGERGDFYTTVGEVASGLEEAPSEPGIYELLADPAIREQIAEGGRAIEASTAPPSSTTPPGPGPAPPPAPQPPPPAAASPDRTKPTVTITNVRVSRRRGRGRMLRASVFISFIATDNRTPRKNLGIRCGLDRGAFKSCESVKIYRSVRRGKHTITVRVSDSAGNRKTVTRSFQVRG